MKAKLLILCGLLSGVVYAAPAKPTVITAKSWLVADGDGTIIDGVNIGEVRSIASVTKLVTVMVVIDSGQDLTEIMPTKLFKNVTRRNLIDLSIIHSDNNAARILCEQYTGGYTACIAAMNEKVKSLGMNDTVFMDSTGLNNDNVSTATDLLKLVHAASMYPIITEDSNRDKVQLLGKKNKLVSVNNTNPLVGRGYDFIVSKTGFINRSGGCIVILLNTAKGTRAVILLGSRNTKTRIPEAALLSTR
jgi:D-alanyl-D-alanine endopeptidase (penicillin-binding protein 7)